MVKIEMLSLNFEIISGYEATTQYHFRHTTAGNEVWILTCSTEFAVFGLCLS